MKQLSLVIVFLLLTGCERGSSISFSSNSVFISENEISLLYTVKKHGFKSSFLDHGDVKSWTEWSKKIKVNYSYVIGSNNLDMELFHDSIDIIEDLKKESSSNMYLVSENRVFDRFGVRTKDRKHVLINSENKIYDTLTGQVHKDLTDNENYQKFKKIISSKYEYRVMKENKYGNLSTLYDLSNNAEYIVIYPEEVSQPEYIDFNTVYIFDVNSSSIDSHQFNIPNGKYDSFRITDVENINGDWICLFGFFEDGEYKSAIWYSEDNIVTLPFDFYGSGSYDIWNIEKGYFAELQLFTTDQKFNDLELTIFDYKSAKSYVLKLNIKNAINF